MTTPEETERLRKRAIGLEWLTIGWNLIEVFVAIGLGIAARSLALVAFGLDSIIEVFASLVVVWHLRRPGWREHPGRTVLALRMVGAAFFALAAVLAVAAVSDLVSGRRPDESPIGVAYLAATVVVMLVLARLKRSTGDALGASPLVAEAGVTLLDAALAAGILLALLANIVLGWWWADPLAALLVAAVAVREGRETFSEIGEIASG